MKNQTTATEKTKAQKSVEATEQKIAANQAGFVRVTRTKSVYREGAETKEIEVLFIAANTITEITEDENGGTWLALHQLTNGAGRAMKKANESLTEIFNQLAICRK